MLIIIPVMFLSPVYADVPSIFSIEPWTSGSETILNITIRHSSPTGSHYVDLIQVDIEGIVNDVGLNSQSASPFVAEYNIGELIGEPSVKVRAHCNLHGWGSWSTSQVIPEFPSWIILPLFVAVTMTVMFYRKRLTQMEH